MIWVALIVAVVALYIGYVVLYAYLDVKSRPREPMILCDKHGAYRVSHAITFCDVPYCPRCFAERLRENPLP